MTGESYGEYLRKHILDPLGMRASGHDREASRLIPLAASGYFAYHVGGRGGRSSGSDGFVVEPSLALLIEHAIASGPTAAHVHPIGW